MSYGGFFFLKSRAILLQAQARWTEREKRLDIGSELAKNIGTVLFLSFFFWRWNTLTRTGSESGHVFYVA